MPLKNLEKIKEVMGTYQPEMDIFELDARSLWLSGFGVLTPQYLERMVVILQAIDEGVASIDIDYDKDLQTLDMSIYLRPVPYYFKKKKITKKFFVFIERNLSKYEVVLKVRKYKRNKFVGDMVNEKKKS